jgi:hypothetical protein
MPRLYTLPKPETVEKDAPIVLMVKTKDSILNTEDMEITESFRTVWKKAVESGF